MLLSSMEDSPIWNLLRESNNASRIFIPYPLYSCSYNHMGIGTKQGGQSGDGACRRGAGVSHEDDKKGSGEWEK